MPTKTSKKPKSTVVMGVKLSPHLYLSVLEKPTAKAMLARLNQIHARLERETFHEKTLTPKKLSRAARNCDLSRAPKARCGVLFANARDLYKFLDQIEEEAAMGRKSLNLDSEEAKYSPRRAVQTLLNLMKFGVQAEAWLKRLQVDAE